MMLDDTELNEFKEKMERQVFVYFDIFREWMVAQWLELLEKDRAARDEVNEALRKIDNDNRGGEAPRQ